MNSQEYRNLQKAYLEVVENHQLDEGMDMKDFKANRRNIKRKEASDDATKRGHVGKTWVDGGRTYSPDEAKSRRAKMTDGKRQALYRVANDPDDDSPDDDHYPASKTTNPKKLRKQRVMGEIGESYDLYDIILSHLIDEGYADTQEAAEHIMVNMTEEWRESIVEGIGSAIKSLFGKKKKPEAPKPLSRGAELRARHNTGPDKSETSAKRKILDKTRERAERDEKEYGDSTYSKSVATKSREAHNKYLRAGYNKYGADRSDSGGMGGSGGSGSGNKARKRATALNNSYDLFDYMMEYLISEGYADTNENALVIMANMSEEWRENILTEVSQKEFDDGMRKAAAKMPSDVRTPSREELFGSKEERSKVKTPKGVVNPTPDTSANIRKSSEYSSPRASRGLPAAGYN